MGFPGNGITALREFSEDMDIGSNVDLAASGGTHTSHPTGYYYCSQSIRGQTFKTRDGLHSHLFLPHPCSKYRTSHGDLSKRKKGRNEAASRKTKIFSSWDSPVIAHLTTNQPIASLSMGERTGT
jgi:hypothetical protein